MSVTINGTTGITTPDVTSDSYTGPLSVSSSAPDNSVVVNSSGNVGIGTSSPSALLHLNANNAEVRLSETGTYYGSILVDSAGGLTIAADPTNVAANSRLIFRVDGSERARIDSSGNLLVGTTTAVTTNVAGVMFAKVGTQGRMTIGSTSTAAQDLAYFFNPNGIVGSIQTNGSSTSYVTSSDYRLKEDIQPMIGALAKVAALKPCTYKWKADGSDGEGFIAHELAEVVPACVTGEKDAVEIVEIKDENGNVTGTEERPVYQGIDTSFLVSTLTAAIQEQQALIESLTARVAALEGAQNV